MNLDPFSSSFEHDNYPYFDPLNDQCGSGRLAWMVPDRPAGVDLRRICYVHDADWNAAIKARSWRMAHEANLRFYQRIVHQAIVQGLTETAAHIWGQLYYRGVESLAARLHFWRLALKHKIAGWWK